MPFLDQNLRTKLPNVWAAGDYVVNPTNFISSIGEGKRVAEAVDPRCAAPAERRRIWRSRGSRPSTSPTPNPLVAEGIAEWSLTAMSRRLVWGDDYAGVGRQMMPSLPVPSAGIGTHDTTLEVEVGLHETDRV